MNAGPAAPADSAATTPPRARGPRAAAKRSEGQWKVDGTTPLNGNEEFKQEDDGLNVRQRIEDVYSKQGFASIDPKDLRGRMRWWGLYTQRREGIDGGRTASIPPEELDAEYFMMRVRIDGGALTTEQLRVLGQISVDFARGTADVTDRQNIQYHWIRVEDVPEIWRRLESVGLSTTEACGDCPRVVLGSPVAGIAADEILDGTWAVEEINRRYVGDPQYSNLPRKFKSAVSGSPRQDVVHEINDVAFIGSVHPEHGPGFDVWVGGGLSTSAHLAQRLGAWVPLEEVPDVWAGVVGIFRDYGYRRLRNRARLKYLVADWGAEKFRQVLEEEYLHRKLVDGPAPEAVNAPDHIGVHKQVDGRNYVGVAPAVGRVNGELLLRLADVMEAHGSQRLRTTAHQKLVVLDVADEQVESFVAAADELGLPARTSQWRRSTMACTGVEFCKLAIVETKHRATELITEMERRLPDLAEPVTVNINGCPNSCARIQTADIGLKGQIVTTDAGEQVPGFQVHLGGGLGLDVGFGRKLRGHKVTAAELPDYVERLTRRWLEQRGDGERFAQWATRADEEDLR
ncbi:sulfite reductase (ferredoxin) [Kineococcus xinjiangensis]|uniref:assimilatory sulfite reductase (ferredoxin) n=1 Tax=Kineococcus xinjiangensis TaxID=512762 RepID=A0A2S6IU51_9ACTN|nr:nitrite/sulfite reductase [Kineococcus xinjiangensis]PPK97586.1 sulfite reductase (ferredoxin) [Kineococcus xinjiangensis]